MNGGDTFLFLHLPRKHLCVVISDPPSNPTDPVVIVSFTTYRPGKVEATCLLDVGDHPFITHKTAVDYGKSRLESKAELDRLVRNHGVDLRDPLGADVLDRIRAGASKSPHLAGDRRKVLNDQGLLP